MNYNWKYSLNEKAQNHRWEDKKKVEEETNQSTDDELMDFLSEDEEEENEFQPADDIEIEQDATETRGRRLKNNVIIGGIAAAVLLGGFMIFYDKICVCYWGSCFWIR